MTPRARISSASLTSGHFIRVLVIILLYMLGNNSSYVSCNAQVKLPTISRFQPNSPERLKTHQIGRLQEPFSTGIAGFLGF